eukprot:6175243-Pleurochrysis_carterae.AAC.2
MSRAPCGRQAARARRRSRRCASAATPRTTLATAAPFECRPRTGRGMPPLASMLVQDWASGRSQQLRLGLCPADRSSLFCG